MDLNNYEELLDRAYDKIPDNIKQSSRFEIPKVKIRYESKNTFIRNFFKIINTLNRDKGHFLGVFLKNLGTFGEIRGQQLFLKSQHKKEILDRLIENYTKTYVLCKVCNKPDTEILREGKKSILKCTACGARTEIKE